MWKGRFTQPTADLVRQYTESISFDARLSSHDIAGSIAHAAALAQAGILSPEEKEKIEITLRAIASEIERGEFRFDTALEDVHMNIEAELTKRIGDAGARLHTARSRNDQVALDLRLYCRAEIQNVQKFLRDLQRALVSLGAQNATAIMPGYTHLQRAQPVLFAHHLLAYVEMFERDFDRLADALTRVNVLPLGSGALAGSTITLDRELIARLLDFPALSQNSMDAVSDRDFGCEALAAVAIVGMHLSRLSEDMILWASSEFRFITISDAFTTGSSLMPQKKNPDVAELTRGKTGRLYGNLFALLTVLKGLPLTYNRDMQEDKEAIFDSFDTVKGALQVFAAMLGEVEVNAARMADAAGDANLLATDVAEYLVKQGVAFRAAHEIVGKLVGHCAKNGTTLRDLAPADFQKFSQAFQSDVVELFDPRKSLDARQTAGSPSSANVAAQLKRWEIALHVS